QHAVERFHQRRQGKGQLHVMQQPAQVLQGVGYTLQKMSLALVESAKAISPQRLQDADIDVAVVMMQKGFALHINEAGKLVDIEVEELLAQLRRQISLSIVQQGSDVILQRSLAAALIVQEKRLP